MVRKTRKERWLPANPLPFNKQNPKARTGKEWYSGFCCFPSLKDNLTMWATMTFSEVFVMFIS